jgi:hypothetical protein
MELALLFSIFFYGLTLPLCFAVNSMFARRSGRWHIWPIMVSAGLPILLLLALMMDDVDGGLAMADLWSRDYWDNLSIHLLVYCGAWAILSGLTAVGAQWFGVRAFNRA